MRHPTMLLACLATLACSGLLQSYEAGVEVICEAPSTCGTVCDNAAPEYRLALMAAHVEERLKNPEAREMFEALGHAGPDISGSLLRAEATAAGLSSCPMADELDRRAAMEP